MRTRRCAPLLEKPPQGGICYPDLIATDCRCSIQDKTRTLLGMSLGNVTALYDLKKVGGFKAGDLRGIEFATARLALGAQFARDMIYAAWRARAEGMVGYPMVNVRDIERGKVRATRELMGAD